MIVITSKKSVRKPADSFVNLSRMDYELVCNILRLLDETGFDDEELSFLLGKRNKYFFDVIDPREKQKLKTDQSDPLAAIFGRPHRKILPLNVKHREMIQLHHATRTETEVVSEDEKTKTTIYTYSHIVYPPGGPFGRKIIWEKTEVKGLRYKLNDAVLEFLDGKVTSGYFRKPRLALPLYLAMKKALPPDSFSVADLERGLARLLRKGGPLMRTTIDTQYHYHNWHETFLADPSDRPRLVEIWEASVRATHHFLKEEDIQFFLPMVCDDFIPQLEVYGIRNREDVIMGFIGLTANKVEMLFLHPEYAGCGLGAFLLAKAIKLKGKPLYVEVNEQNPDAIRFYKRTGFRAIGRSELDASGRPFPIVHMELPKNGEAAGDDDGEKSE